MPSAVRDQLERLAGDIERIVVAAESQVRAVLDDPPWRNVGAVYLTGDGDSFHACLATEMAFEVIAGVPCIPLSSQRLVGYPDGLARRTRSGPTLVVGVSSSGRTPRTIEALETARRAGALTLGLTGAPASPVTTTAHRAIVVELQDLTPGPGVRTFQASLAALFCLVAGLRSASGDDALGDEVRGDVLRASAAIHATVSAVLAGADAAVTALASATPISVIGTGPSTGTAAFGAAKLVEAVGVSAHPQDLEEWWHVDRFIRPADRPVIVISPPGRTYGRAKSLLESAAALGRRVVAVRPAEDAHLSGVDSLPVHGTVREELSPLVYHVPLTAVALLLADHLGEAPFRAGERGFRSDQSQAAGARQRS
jgi:glutamine---fructose-6-phosphate transaminase (isomerizing)